MHTTRLSKSSVGNTSTSGRETFCFLGGGFLFLFLAVGRKQMSVRMIACEEDAKEAREKRKETKM
jgi:hypothetical protein